MIPWKEQLAILGRAALWLIWGPRWLPAWGKLLTMIITPIIVISWLNQLWWAIALAGFILIITGGIIGKDLEP